MKMEKNPQNSRMNLNNTRLSTLYRLFPGTMPTLRPSGALSAARQVSLGSWAEKLVTFPNTRLQSIKGTLHDSDLVLKSLLC